MRATPFTLALVALLAAGCSKSQPDLPQLGSGEPSNLSGGVTKPARAFEPEEACMHACLAAGPSEKLGALDDCMMDSCYGDPPMEDPTVGACAAVGPGKVSYGVAARDRCVARSCCAKATACAGDPACASALACVVRCHAK